MREVLGKLLVLAFRSPYFMGQLTLSAILSIGCTLLARVFLIFTFDQIVMALTYGGLDIAMPAVILTMMFIFGLLLILITKSSILGTMKSANRLVEEAGEVAVLTRRLVTRNDAPVEASKGGLSLDVPSGAEGMLSQAAYDAHGLEVALEVSDEAHGVAFDLDGASREDVVEAQAQAQGW